MRKKSLFLIFVFSLICVQNIFAQRYWNTAAQFNGTNHISVAPSANLNTLSGSFSAECWFNSGNINTTATLFGKESFRILLESVSVDFVRVRVQLNGSTYLYSSTYNYFQKNRWNHVAVTYDSVTTGLLRIYYNGNLDTARTGANIGPRVGNDSLTIGNGIFGAYKGMIDDIRIWERALTNAEVTANFRNPYYGALNTYNAANYQSGIILACSFDFPASGPFTSLYFYDGYNSYYNRGAASVNLGKNPSQTLAVNYSLKLDGFGYGRAIQSPNINLNAPLTVEAWVYPTSFGPAEQFILKKGTNYSISITPTGVVYYYYGSSAGLSNRALPLNQWTHIAVKFEPNGIGTLYLNGTLNAAYNLGAIPPIGLDTLLIGTNSNGVGRFKGYIDAVKISNYTKSQDEVRKDMYSMIDVSNTPPQPKSTVSYDFEFQSWSSTSNASTCDLMGSAVYTCANGYNDGVPISPVMGLSNANFPSGYLLRYSPKTIPEAGTAGYTYDTINVTTSAPVTDLKLFIDLNHPRNAELQIKLISPQGDEVIVYDRHFGNNIYSSHLITVFTDNAESDFETGKYVSFSPTIKPVNTLNSVFAGRNPQGKWRLEITDFLNGNSGVLYTWGLRINNSVDVKNISSEIPSKYNLSQNYPNPFNPSTKINFSLSKAGIVSLKVFDIAGKEVAELLNNNLSAGSYEAEFNGTDLSSGVYFYTLNAEAFTETKKMVLVK